MNTKEISKIALLSAAIVGTPLAVAESTARSTETDTIYKHSETTTQVERESNRTSDTAQAQNQAETNIENNPSNAQAGTHVQILSFDADSVTLKDTAQERLETLARTLDKDTPTNVTVKIQGQSEATSSTDDAQSGRADAVASDRYSSADENLADSSGANQTLGTDEANYRTSDIGTAQRLQQEIQENNRLISQHRAERVKQFLEDRGIDVAVLNVEDPVEAGAASDATSAAQTPATQPDTENMQDVLIVITEEQRREGLSAR